MRNHEQEAVALETELLRLNALVRERRAQLDKLQDCPNADCPCRVVWKDHVEKNLASQVHKIRKEVRTPSARPARASAARSISGKRGRSQERV